MTIPKISVCIPTKNSERTIELCLKSVKNWVNEIVVLDCKSTDKTLNICQGYGAYIYHHDFKDFVSLRQTLIKKANNNWILFLDSDEEVSPQLQKEILTTLKKNNGIVAYYIPIKNYMFGESIHMSPKPKPRLARKDVIDFSRKYVHPGLCIKEEWVNKTRKLRNPILHHTYLDVSDYLAKFRQYTSLEALKLVDEGKKPNLLKTVLIGLAKIVYLLFCKRGVMDGYRGLFFASMTFQYDLVVYAKVQDLRRLIREHPKEWRDVWIERECQR